jgi:hypothetical protein
MSAACGRAGSPWVAVAFRGEALDSRAQKAVLLDLRAGLRLAGIDTCMIGAEGREPPLAVLELESSAPSRVLVSIEVHDALTQKRVQRDLDMSRTAADARPLAIAAAAEELLRASWVELSLIDAPAPSRPPPVEVERVVEASLKPSAKAARSRASRIERANAAGARFAIERFTAGLTQLGADAYLTLWVNELLGIEASAGMRRGVRASGAHGDVQADAIVVRAQGVIALVPRERTLGLLLKLGPMFSSMRMRGIAANDGEGSEGAGIGVHARGTLQLSVRPWPALGGVFEAGAGIPLRVIEATDDGQTVASMGGAELHATAGLEARF